MSSDDHLPVILVSAVDTAAALAIIRELISDDAEPPQPNGVGSHEGDAETEDAAEAEGVVWQLQNKYYTARVRLLPCGDRARRPPAPDAQAHLIYLTEDECVECTALSRRAAWAAERRLARGAVRLAGARCAEPPPALQAAAAAARYELVPLAGEPEPEPEPEPFPELRGAARLREALHAHPWPGLRLRRRGAVGSGSPRRLSEEDSSAESSGDESWGSWRRAGDGGGGGGEDEAGAVERAEQFAAALALLPAAAEARGAGDAGDAGGRGAGDAARRLRAEQLVAAFCRALGHDLAGGGDGDGGGGTQ